MSFFRIGLSSNRVFGLDLLRFVAIFMVLIGHSKLNLPVQYKPIFDKILLDGVAIFFVLSGFLIGGILIKQLERDQPTFGGLVHFWKRRWMRTLPAYLVVLTFLLIYVFILAPKHFPADWWKYPLFIQNFINERNEFFAESWSLSIEEWFYLTVPVLLFGALYLFKTSVKNTVGTVSVVVLALITYYRYATYHSFEFTGTTANIKELKDFIETHLDYQVIPRLDAILFGLIGAYVAFYAPKLWNHKFNILLAILGAWILYYTKQHMGKSYLEFAVVWFPIFKSIGVLLMLPFMANWKKGLGNWTSWVTFFSLISYSMYLLNLNVVSNVIIKNIIHGNWVGVKWANLTATEQFFNDEKKYYVGKHIVTNTWVMDYALFWIFTIGLSFLLYKLVEVPFMKLRDSKKNLGANVN